MYKWSKKHDSEKGYILDVIDKVCEKEVLKCNCNMPVIKSVPINFPEGNFVGIFQIRL